MKKIPVPLVRHATRGAAVFADGRFGADDTVDYRNRALSQTLQPGFAALA